jgi:hypothetical protein
MSTEAEESTLLGRGTVHSQVLQGIPDKGAIQLYDEEGG